MCKFSLEPDWTCTILTDACSKSDSPCMALAHRVAAEPESQSLVTTWSVKTEKVLPPPSGPEKIVNAQLTNTILAPFNIFKLPWSRISQHQQRSSTVVRSRAFQKFKSCWLLTPLPHRHVILGWSLPNQWEEQWCCGRIVHTDLTCKSL
jgi:hypothetical protein